jgi:hypothetical protein
MHSLLEPMLYSHPECLGVKHDEPVQGFHPWGMDSPLLPSDTGFSVVAQVTNLRHQLPKNEES